MHLQGTTREAIAIARHALKLLASRCFGERRGNELRRLYAYPRGCVFGRVARNSFSLVYPLVPHRISFLSRSAGSLALAASPTAVRALTCHWPCPLASAARSLVCLLGHLSIALPLRLFFILFSFSFSSRLSPSDSRVYSRAFIVH